MAEINLMAQYPQAKRYVDARGQKEPRKTASWRANVGRKVFVDFRHPVVSRRIQVKLSGGLEQSVRILTLHAAQSIGNAASDSVPEHRTHHVVRYPLSDVSGALASA